MRVFVPIFCLAATALATPAVACDYPGGPPDAREVRATGEGVTWAYYSNATTIYDHGILGDAIEASVLRAETPLTGPCDSMIYLGDDAVFEDVTPRIADVTGNGLNDVVVIETRLDSGASLAVYGMDGESFVKLAASPHIGSPHRWLAPAGIADFDGDGVLDVAYVETPHIGGTLRIWSFKDNQPRQIASAPGYSNHRIGQNFITGGLRDCGNGPELVLPNADWSQTLLAWQYGGEIESAVLFNDARPETIAKAMECK
ncbi:MAG TPA: VCBS repeat-containing protein [Thermohalobaculum sp.]|nr:VCBS repeat-containing protein [Thermohalobaculum sp.]